MSVTSLVQLFTLLTEIIAFALNNEYFDAVGWGIAHFLMTVCFIILILLFRKIIKPEKIENLN